MKYNLLQIRDLKPVIPIIQGGMAVRVSTGNLAGAVAKCNAVGVIGASGMSLDELKDEIKIARDIAEGNGIIAVNIMVAAHDFLTLSQICIDEKVDLIIAGAGFSMDIFKMTKGTTTEFAPVVSSAKAAKLGLKLGAAAVIVEGKEAGGHLGTDRPLRDILKEVLDAIDGKIPVIGAGGILHGSDICEILNMGASGVQMATRFVLSDECTVDDKYKQYYLDHTKEDMKLFLSPVGYPGRAIVTKFLTQVEEGKIGRFPCKHLCLKSCNRRFCIIESLITAQKGNVDDGIMFAGERFSEIKDILPVKVIIDNLLEEIKNC